MELLDWLGRIAGAGLLASGGWLIAQGRSGVSRAEGARPGAMVRLGGGLALAGLGYHVLAWSLPRTWVAFAAPPDRWWVVVGVCGLVAIGTWRLDRGD